MKLLMTLALAVITSYAQTPTFRARIDAVQIDALVSDGRRPIPNLGPGDFELRDNGVLQRIERVGAQDVPLEIIVLLDTSSSVAGKPLIELKQAAKATIQSLRPELDRASVLTFSHRVEFATPLTSDRSLVAHRIDGFDAGGGTAVLDAVAAGLMLRRTPGARRLLLVYTDGLDTFSWLTPDEVLAIAHRADAVVYFVSTLPLDGSDAAKFADATGGAYFGAANTTKVRNVFARVIEEFKNRYLISYYPQGVDLIGWHSIDVRLKGRRGRVQARRGYQAD